MSHRLLFLPGAGADPGYWHPLGELLPLAWQKVYLGWPGLGRQPPDPRFASLDDLVALVEAQLGEGPVDLLAQSMGGAVAMRVALRNPGKVGRMVLAVTSGGVDVSGLGGRDWRPTYRARFPVAADFITAPTPDLSGELWRITQPVLLLWGEADPISPVAVGERLASLLPDARLHIVPGGDHGFVEQHPEAVAELIRAHLE